MQFLQKYFADIIILLIFLFKPVENVNIGLLYQDPDILEVFMKSIDTHGTEEIPLIPFPEQITNGDAYSVSRKMKELIEKEVKVIMSTATPNVASYIRDVCDENEILYIDISMDFNTELPTINLYPYPYQLASSFRDLVVEFAWERFTILYEAERYLYLTRDLLDMVGHGPTGPEIYVRKLELKNEKTYRNILKRAKMNGDENFLVIGFSGKLDELMKQLQQVGMVTDGYKYILGNFDLLTIDLESYKHSGANISAVRLVSPENSIVQDFLTKIELSNMNVTCPLTLEMALIHDGIQLVVENMKIDPELIDKTYTLVNFMKTISFDGMSGPVSFDNQGFRSVFTMEVFEVTTSGSDLAGTWDADNKFQNNRKPLVLEADKRALANQTLVVMTALSDPYGMLKETSAVLTGNEQYEGFGIDIIDELSKKLGFNYVFRIQADGVYGSLNKETNEFSGMLKEIIEGRADLGITDLTMTADRESGVDFTIPFMNLGISILFKKPTKEPPKLFSFMSPFEGDVWLSLGLGCLAVACCLFALGRMSPDEWDNPYPCIEEPTELENQFSFANSVWFAVASLLQQGSELAPKAAATRAVASIWWFFTMILVSSYTANLAAFLTVESLSSPIESAEDLAAGKVPFGAKGGGATFGFFKDATYPTYVKMYEFMKDHPEYMPKSNEEGVRRAENEDYAFLMESSSIEYTIERRCTLNQVGGLLDEKGYGIAMRKNYPYRDMFSQAVLEMQEGAVLAKLKTKWWKEKRGGGACVDDDGDGGATPLEVANLAGVFLVLYIGAFVAFICGVLEWIFVVRAEAKKEKVPFCVKFKEEFKFMKNFSETTREVEPEEKDSSESSSSSDSKSKSKNKSKSKSDSKSKSKSKTKKRPSTSSSSSSSSSASPKRKAFFEKMWAGDVSNIGTDPKPKHG